MVYKIKSRKARKSASESIAATDAAKNFGRLVDRVREEGATYVIERHGRPVAQIGPVETEEPKTLSGLVEYLKTAPKLDEEVLRYIEEGIAVLQPSGSAQEPMGTLVDTSVLIAAQHGDIDIGRKLVEDGDQAVAIATICVSELLHGPHRLTNAVARARAERSVENLLARFTIVDFDIRIARLHARLAADLSASGTQVGAHDSIIAATAMALDYRVATRDRRSFPRIPGLDVVYW